MRQIGSALRAGAAYWLIIFGIGFALGTLRELVLRRHMGEMPAILLETPLMLLASWLTARWLIRHFELPARVPDRLVMGLFALALLLLAEVLVGIFLIGQNLQQHLASYATIRGVFTLASQGIFALIPVLSLAWRRPI